VYPAELPPETELNCRRALSNETVIWYPPRTAGVEVPLGEMPVTEDRLTNRVACTVAPTFVVVGLGEMVTEAVPLIGAP
jgi:hypothetical protein